MFLSAPGSVDGAPRKLEPAPQEVTAVISDRMHAWLQGHARTLGSKTNKKFNESKTENRTEGKTWTQTVQAPGNVFLLTAQGLPPLKQQLSGLTTANLLGKQVFRPPKDLVTDTKSF